MKAATFPVEISTNLAEASAVPPVAIKSSILGHCHIHQSSLYEHLLWPYHIQVQNQQNEHRQVVYFSYETG